MGEWSLERLAAVAALVSLAIGCALVLQPFFSALLWAAILVFAAWPIYDRLEWAFSDRPTLAAGASTLLLAAAFVAPLALAGVGLADQAANLARDVGAAFEGDPPSPPSWLREAPVVGGAIEAIWREAIASGARVSELLEPYMATLRSWAIASGLTIGNGLVQLSISVFVSFFLFRDGRTLVERISNLAAKIGGAHGRELMRVAGSTVQGVVYGLIGTAIAQGGLAWFGFALAGVPGAPILGIATFVLSMLPPIGPPLIWIPATLWLLAEGSLGWGVFMGLWGALVVSSVDNFLKPYLISRESDLPFLLVFFGVLGGVFAFGFLGLFLGPTLLAVGYALLREWSAHNLSPDAPAAED